LQGEVDHKPAYANLHNIQRMIHSDSISDVYPMHLLNKDSSPLQEVLLDMQPALAELLRNYVSIFSIPTSLPPTRSHDHAIPLIDGYTLVKVKPYRYPHSQKS